MSKHDAFVEIEVGDVIDLHTFKPSDVKDLIPEYIMVCRQKGIRQVRIIHGKGKGTMKRIVHSVLSRMPEVTSFKLDGGGAGSWGATIAVLNPVKSQEE